MWVRTGWGGPHPSSSDGTEKSRKGVPKDAPQNNAVVTQIAGTGAWYRAGWMFGRLSVWEPSLSWSGDAAEASVHLVGAENSSGPPEQAVRGG